jgi:cell pole-organizing protein PopZ
MQQGEPSLEEILASIKKVMARDEDGSAGAGASTRPAAESARGASADGVEPADHEEADDILDLGMHMLISDTPVAGQPEWTEAGPSYLAAEPPAGASDLPQQDAASAVRKSLAALERLSGSGSPQPSASPRDPALEALTREMLRPMLTEWLDANLPAIVERLVQAEIARIVGGRG